jgi:hypothetical protein
VVREVIDDGDQQPALVDTGVLGERSILGVDRRPLRGLATAADRAVLVVTLIRWPLRSRMRLVWVSLLACRDSIEGRSPAK